MSAREVAARRRQRLNEAMQEAGVDLMILFGNAWQNDYLRYAADFGILEGEGIAVVRRDGDTTLYLDDFFEAERAAIECPDIGIVASADMVGEVADLLTRAGESSPGGRAAPDAALPAVAAPRRAWCS